MNRTVGNKRNSNGQGQGLFAGVGLPRTSRSPSRSTGVGSTGRLASSGGGGGGGRGGGGGGGELMSSPPRKISSPGGRAGRSHAEKDRYIAELENERDEVLRQCEAYKQNVRDLRVEINTVVVRVNNKQDMKKRYRWNSVDRAYSDVVTKFCKEWLFSRYKFFQEDWMEYDDSRGSLPELVFKHCALPVGMEKEDAWRRIAAPSIATKYTNMRCNANTELRKAFLGKIGLVILKVVQLVTNHIVKSACSAHHTTRRPPPQKSESRHTHRGNHADH